jgi:hypothetical protein
VADLGRSFSCQSAIVAELSRIDGGRVTPAGGVFLVKGLQVDANASPELIQTSFALRFHVLGGEGPKEPVDVKGVGDFDIVFGFSFCSHYTILLIF